MNKLIKNASWIIVCKIIQSLLSFVVSMMTARYLGPSNYGVINYAQSLVAFVGPITLLGFGNILVKELVNNPEKEGELIGTTTFFSFISSLICIAAVILYTMIANRGEHETILVCALFSITLSIQSFELIEYWFQAKLLSKYSSIVSLIAYIIVSGFKIYLLATEKNIYWFVLSYIIDYLFISVSLFAIYKHKDGQKCVISKNRFRQLIKQSYPYILSTMMVTIFTQTDKIMLKQLIDPTSVGYYSTAVVLAGIASFFFQAIIDSFRPKLFDDYKADKKQFETNIIGLYSLVIYLSLLFCTFVSVFARPIVLFTYGEGYRPAISTLRIVVWFTTFTYLGIVRNIWILTENKQKLLTRINLVGALTNVVLNFLLIPILGINGAAIASLITQATTNFVIGYVIKPIRYNNNLIIQSLNPAVAIGVIHKVAIEIVRKKK